MRKELISFYSKYKFFIFPTIVALSSLFLIIFVIYPQVTKLIDNQKVTSDLISKSEKMEVKASTLESYNGEDLSRKVNLALGVYPADKELAGMIGLLQQLVGQSGFTIDSITLEGGLGKVANAGSFNVRLEVKGAKVLFQTLLNNLENAKRIVKVGSIDVTVNEATQSLSASLSVDVLYSDIPKSFGSVDASLPEINQEDEQLIAKISTISTTGAFTSTMSATQKGKVNPFE